MNYETDLLTYCVQSTKAIDQVLIRRITKEQFSNFDESKLFDIIIWVYRKYKCLVTEAMLKQLLEKSTVKLPEDQKRIALLFFQLSQATLPTSPVDFVIDQVVEKYVKGQLENTIKSAAGALRDKETTKALDLLKSNIAKISAVSNEERLEEGYIGEGAAGAFLNYSDKKNNPTKFGGLSTGYPRFDAETSGLQKGQVVMVMGAPKSAKSIFLVNVARNAVKQGKRVLFIVNEGGKDLVLRRYMSLDAGVNYTKLRDGKLSSEEEQQLQQAVVSQKGSKQLYVCSIPPVLCTTSLISTKMGELESEGKFDLVVIDYMGLMASDNPSVQKEEDWKRLGSIALELKSFAMTKHIPVLTVFHVSREGNKKKGSSYGMNDISRSWEILKTIDMLISWKVDDQEEFDILHSGSITLKIAASRDSAPSLIEMWADLNIMSIQEKVSGFSVDHPELDAAA